MVFVHGFGASIGHFRKNIPALSQKYKVTSFILSAACIAPIEDCFQKSMSGMCQKNLYAGLCH